MWYLEQNFRIYKHSARPDCKVQSARGINFPRTFVCRLKIPRNCLNFSRQIYILVAAAQVIAIFRVFYIPEPGYVFYIPVLYITQSILYSIFY